jgi:hypothetical protein
VIDRSLAPSLGVAGGLAGFWVTSWVASGRQPDYDPRIDYLSALASSGAVQPGWGIAMFVFGGLALLAASVSVARAGVEHPRMGRAASSALLAGSVAVLVAGMARVGCPDGAAGCNAGPRVAEATSSGAVHAWSVGAYQVCLTVAALVLAWAVHAHGRRGAAVGLTVAAITVTVLALDPLPLQPGSSQRLWVAAGHALLVGLVVVGAGRATVSR